MATKPIKKNSAKQTKPVKNPPLRVTASKKVIKEVKARKIKKKHFFAFGLAEEKNNFLENLSLMLSAGMDFLSALEAIKSEIRSRRMRRILEWVKSEVEDGSALFDALNRANIFPEQAVSLIKIGEQSGRLVENLKVIVLQQQKERNFKSKIRSAMMYPVFVLGITVFVGLGIGWFILPRLSTVFSSLDVELPLITRLLIDFGGFISLYGYIAVPAFIAFLAVGGFFFFIFPPTKIIGQAINLLIPGIKTLIKQAEIARFGYVFGTLLQAGLPVTDALASLGQVTNIRSYQKFYQYLGKNIEEGNSFKKSFNSYRRAKKLIPSSVQQLIFAGEQSGSLAEILIKIGDAYEEKMENTTKNLSVILEPVLLFIVWLGVLAVAVAVILPIYSLVGSFN